MYGLEINFLKDRAPQKDTGPKPQIPVNEKMLMYAGIAAGVLPLLFVGGWWLYQNNQTGVLTAQRDKLKQENAATAAQQQNIDKIKKQTADIKDQTTGLATVFDQLKPWSAMLQDIRDRTPAGVQVTCVAQTLPTTSTDSLANCQAVQPATSAPPPPPAAANATVDPTIPTTDMVVISGRTYDYNNINNLLLVLQQSPFFKPEQTRLLTSELKDFPSGEVQIAQLNTNNTGGGNQPKPTKVVEFTIKTHLSDKPASDPILLRELQRKGALGLVTRIETLQQKGLLPNDLRR